METYWLDTEANVALTDKSVTEVGVAFDAHKDRRNVSQWHNFSTPVPPLDTDLAERAPGGG